MGYAYLNDKVEDILMWDLTDKLEKIRDKKGYKQQQGKHSIIMGIIFLFVPISLYVVDEFEINKKLLYLWILILAGEVILHMIKVRKYY